MHITEFSFVTDLDGFVEALRFFEQMDDPHIVVEHDTYPSQMQTVGSSIHYQYKVSVHSDAYTPINLYPALRELEKRIDKL